MQALDDNSMWDLVPLHTDKKAIGCRWAFVVKFNPDGSVAKLKARFVAKGYAQTYGVDYFDTFSSLGKLTSVRLFISLAASYDWDLHQLDIRKCLSTWRSSRRSLHGATSKACCSRGDRKVCRLRKSLYGLKHIPCAWFGKFS